MRPRLGRLIPWIVALGLSLDAGTRLIPIDLFAFRAWEALVVAHGPTGPFEPNRVYVNPMTYGDLARAERFAAVRRRHLEYFSTDEWGFRRTVSPSEKGPFRWLLIGDSFGVSSGVRDGTTLASQLALRTGERTYNAAAGDPLPLDDIRFTARRLGLSDGVVVFEYMERQPMAAVEAVGGFRMFGDGPPPARSWSERFRRFRKDAAVSRMSIIARWQWDALSARADRAPIIAAGREQEALPTAAARLFNGAPMLFLTGDVGVTLSKERRIPPDYLVSLAAALAPMRLRLAVLIAPTKYQVYGPLVATPNAPTPHGEPLQRFADDLNAKGVFAVNVTEALRKRAADDLARDEYVYFVDDTHWNERGIAVAAQTFVDAWRRRIRN
jgi:hypothetical protein